MMHRTRVLVSYGDILGFGGWIKRPSNAPENVQALMDEVYTEFSHYVSGTNGIAKYVGDGIMVVKELKAGHNCGLALEFMKMSYLFAERIRTIIEQHWPRPLGFRLRMVEGHVYQKTLPCWNCRNVKASGTNVEFVGYPINLAQRLLYVDPQILCICHESVTQILGSKRGELVLERIRSPQDNPRGVDIEDLRNLYKFKVKQRKGELNPKLNHKTEGPKKKGPTRT